MSAVIAQALWIYALAALVAAVIAVVIRGVVWLLGWLERPAASRAAGAGPAPDRATLPGPALAMPAAGAEPARETIPAEHVAAIAAAVAATLGGRRVVRIDDPHTGASWAARGRATHTGSHPLPTRQGGR